MGWIHDLRHAARGFARQPGFTAVAVATLVLGIGAATAIFSFVQGILLKPLPYQDPERLVAVYQDFRARGYPEREVFSYPNFLDVRRRSETLDDLAVGAGWAPNLSAKDGAVQLVGARVSHSYLDLLGVPMWLGRGFLPAEDARGAPRVVVLSHGLWQRELGADPAVIGQTVTLDGEPWTVVGVLAPGFLAPVGPTPDVIRPLRLDLSFGRSNLFLSAIGRLADGVTLAEARSELAAIAAALAEEYPEDNEKVGSAVYPLRSEMGRQARPALLVLLGAVGLLLLIACANVGNLILTRTVGRRAEMAVRSALGAGRGRLVRQLLTESLLLALAGGFGGLLLAWIGVDALKRLVPAGMAIPRLEGVSLDPGIALFATGIALVSGLLIGLAPAFQASRPDLGRPLRDESRSSTSRGGRRVRSVFVVVQAALALVLLVGSALLLQSFLALTRVDPGFRTDRLLLFNVGLPANHYPEGDQIRSFFDRLIERLETLPGVRSVAGSSNLPLSDRNSDTSFTIVGRPAPDPADEPTSWYHQVTAGYFETLGLRLLEGRALDERDRPGTPLSIVVNETFTRRYFPEEPLLGQRLQTGNREWEIVGKVANTKNFGLAEEEPPTLYLAQAQVPSSFLGLVVRTEVDPLTVAPAALRTLSDLDPQVAAAGLTTMDEVLAGAAAPQRSTAFLIALFGLVALTLAAVGLYAVVAYSAHQRTREIGIRMALGAKTGDVVPLVLGQGLSLALFGLAIGLGAAALGSRWLEGLLFEVRPLEPVAYAVSALILALVALVASWLPARRAARLDPVGALRGQ